MMEGLKSKRIKVCSVMTEIHNETERQIMYKHGGFVPSRIYFDTSDAVEDRVGDLMKPQTKMILKWKN